MDLTPRVYPKSKSKICTTGLQLACCVLLDCGMPCMAGSAGDYRQYSGASFYKTFPAVWDETVFLDGEVGGYITEASARKGMSLPLKFLGEGDYEAVIYRDTTKRKLKIDKKTVTRYDILSYDLLAESGYVVKLTKKEL